MKTKTSVGGGEGNCGEVTVKLTDKQGKCSPNCVKCVPCRRIMICVCCLTVFCAMVASFRATQNGEIKRLCIKCNILIN